MYRAYSMEYGTAVGLGWSALFLSYVGGVTSGNGLLILLCFLLCGVCFALPFVLALRINKKLFAIGEKLSYLQGLFFSFSMFMYGCLINGLIVFAYFKFWDDGSLYEQLNKLVTQPDMVETYRQLGMGDQYAQMLELLKQVDSLSAFDKTLAIFNNNFFWGLILSFIVAVVASYNLKNIRKER